MKKVKEILKKIGITFCAIYFVASVIGNIAFYSAIQNEFHNTFKEEDKLIEEYKEKEQSLEKQVNEQKQKKGEEYPAMALLQYTQYLYGAGVIVTIQLKLTIYSVAVSIVVVSVKETIKLIKTRRDVKKNG